MRSSEWGHGPKDETTFLPIGERGGRPVEGRQPVRTHWKRAGRTLQKVCKNKFAKRGIVVLNENLKAVTGALKMWKRPEFEVVVSFRFAVFRQCVAVRQGRSLTFGFCRAAAYAPADAPASNGRHG